MGDGEVYQKGHGRLIEVNVTKWTVPSRKLSLAYLGAKLGQICLSTSIPRAKSPPDLKERRRHFPRRLRQLLQCPRTSAAACVLPALHVATK